LRLPRLQKILLLTTVFPLEFLNHSSELAGAKSKSSPTIEDCHLLTGPFVHSPRESMDTDLSDFETRDYAAERPASNRPRQRETDTFLDSFPKDIDGRIPNLLDRDTHQAAPTLSSKAIAARVLAKSH